MQYKDKKTIEQSIKEIKITNYERDYSHSHCFNNKNSACGDNSDKHLHCCICGIKNPNLNKE